MNLSGFGNNKVFKTGIDPAAPYYTLSASLDLTDAVYDGTYYFNFDNSLAYSQTRDYTNFVILDENSIISDVAVYADPPLEIVSDAEAYFAIGGADYKAAAPDNAVKVWWAASLGYGPYTYPSPSQIVSVLRAGGVATVNTAIPHGLSNGTRVNVFGVTDAGFDVTNVSVTVVTPTQFTYTNAGPPVPLSNQASAFVVFNPQDYPFFNGIPVPVDDVNAGVVNNFGHEGGHFPYFYNPVDDETDTSKRYKYLAVTILDQPFSAAQEEKIDIVEAKSDEKVKSSEQCPAIPRKRKTHFRGLPTGDKAVVKGRLVVTIKVYPKSQ